MYSTGPPLIARETAIIDDADASFHENFPAVNAKLSALHFTATGGVALT